MTYPDVDGIQWRRISPKLALRTLAGALGGLIVFVVATVIVALYFSKDFPYWLFGLVPIVPAVVEIPLSLLRVRTIRYALRDDDLLYKYGVIWRRLVAVPYGRLQVVNITRGPLERILGIATLRTVTASAATDVAIPGLTPQEADELRDYLISVAETRRAGL